jgi:hypothetical protein
MGAAPTHGGVVQPKAAVVVEMQGKDHISKPISRHLTRFDLLLHQSMFSRRRLVAQCFITCYE